jgi:ammonia channel protein AmtB
LKLCGLVLGGIRVGADQEAEGLDITAHGERGYDLKL